MVKAKTTTQVNTCAVTTIWHDITIHAAFILKTHTMPQQKIALTRDEEVVKTRHRLDRTILHYLAVLRSAPVSSPDLRIHRACYILRSVFYAYREATWSRFCAKISLPTRYNGLTVITEDLMKLGRKNGWFADFPQQYFVGNLMAKEKVLAITPCYDIGFLKKLVEQLFTGMSTIPVNNEKDSVDHE
jgi:hypothetical protein